MLAWFLPRWKTAGSDLVVTANETSMVFANKHSEIVVETGSTVHQVIFSL
jgi:hypothetical protein